MKHLRTFEWKQYHEERLGYKVIRTLIDLKFINKAQYLVTKYDDEGYETAIKGYVKLKNYITRGTIVPKDLYKICAIYPEYDYDFYSNMLPFEYELSDILDIVYVIDLEKNNKRPSDYKEIIEDIAKKCDYEVLYDENIRLHKKS